MKEYYKKRMAKHHKQWDESVNAGKMDKADEEMKSYQNYAELLKLAENRGIG